MQAPGFVDTMVAALEAGGLDLRAWGLAWARFAPTIAIVPAFGLRAVPAPARIALGLALAASIAPAVAPAANPAHPWPLQLLIESARKNDKRDAYVKLAVPDEVVKGLRGNRAEEKDLVMLVIVPKEVEQRSESLIILPGEVR